MATLGQLTAAYVAANNGVQPDTATLADLQTFANLTASGQATDAAAFGYISSAADKTTSLAVLSYQFFTGKSPTKAGLDYLTNSPTNANDLNDAYYSKFGIENRYINFAANLGVAGEGAGAFATKYGAMSFTAYVATIYETIIGGAYARAAGIDPAAAIADIVSRQAAIQQTAVSAGMITSGMSAAQIDLAVKAAAAGYLMGESVKADVGVYAAAANNFLVALVNGTAVYNVDVAATYAGQPAQGGGTGQAVLPSFSFPVPVIVVPVITSFTLTNGVDHFTGSPGADTFSATGATFSNGDVLDGGAGSDTLTINATSSVYSGSITVKNIETVHVTAPNTINLNTTAWTGLTQLSSTTTGGGDTYVTAAGATVVTVNATNAGYGTINVYGGSSVSVTSTGGVGGGISVFDDYARTGTVTVNAETIGAYGKFIRVDGGSSVDIRQTATNAVNTTSYNGWVEVNGSSATQSVTVKASPYASATSTVAGVDTNDVYIYDYNAYDDAAGSIATATVDGYNSLEINGNALTSLTASHGRGIRIGNSGQTSPTNTTLNLALNDVNDGDFGDDGVITTLNITTGAQTSRFYAFNAGAVSNLTIAGASVLTLSNAPDLGALETVTVTGAAGLNTNLAGLSNLAEIDASATSGAMTVTIDASHTAYAGGSGVDMVTLVNLPTVAISGGGGSVDLLKMDATAAQTASASGAFAGLVTGFERLTLTGATNQTVDVATLGGYAYVSTNGGNGLSLQGMTSGATLELTGSGTAYTVAGAFTGGSDVLNLKLIGSSDDNVNFASTGITASGVETVAITLQDTEIESLGGNQSVTLLGNSIKSITASGNLFLTLTADSTALTSVDATDLTGGQFHFTTGAWATGGTIKGSATGYNEVHFGAALGAVTYTGGTGSDDVYADNTYANVINLGAGNDFVYVSANGSSTIDVGTGNDTVRLAGPGMSSTVFNTIIGMGDGDMVNLGSGSPTQTAMGAAVTGPNTYAGLVNAAAAGDGSSHALISWFQFDGDTYIVSDNSAGATFVDGQDTVVKLVGVIDLGVASLDQGLITLGGALV